MKEPQHFGGPCGVLNIAMMIIVFLYLGMGFFGYLNYGDSIEATITLNLPSNEM
jgi:proton-coupled amino acid transporter